MEKTPKIYKFKPDYAVPPGETLLEVLEHKGMTQADLVERSGRPVKTINEIVQGKAAITPETALQLERVLGVPASFWNNLEKNYRQALARLAEEKALEAELSWLKKLPIKALEKSGWIPKCNNPVEQLKAALDFFGLASPGKLALVSEKAAIFRQSDKIKTNPFVGAAWLRKGEVEAQKIQSPGFDSTKFKQNLEAIRALTRAAFNQDMINKWRGFCLEAGVVLLFVKEIQGLRVNGATYWLKDKAVIQLSLRHKRDDILWFTFFHEAGHILKHGRKEVFIDQDQDGDEKEEEADRFAADFLISDRDYEELLKLPKSRNLINSFASRIGINPGIVVGRLQHEKVVPPSWMNDLKRPLCWAK
ncbi:MAG: helix-turn-helix domain-containing protein [Candidatus Omnitrophica bacterium]|nr:helix-turn-helix domain-containing protein [Candidatus Omnitrophota bacterium]